MKEQYGFTLIELVIVIGIFAALSTFFIIAVDPFTQFQKANDARRKSDLSQIQEVLEQYYKDNGRYPCSTSNTSVPPCTIGAATPPYRIKMLDGSLVDWGKSWAPYMNVLPKDPDPDRNYVYFVSNDGQAYYFYASLERGAKDPQACTGGVCSGLGRKSDFPVVGSCGKTCNYGVSSPNESP